jgi:hypothetical protein
MSYSAFGTDPVELTEVMQTLALSHCISAGGDPSACVEHFGGDPESYISREVAVAGCIGSGGDPERCENVPYALPPEQDQVTCAVALSHCISAGGEPTSCTEIFAPCEPPESYMNRQAAIAGCIGAGGDPYTCEDLAPMAGPPNGVPPAPPNGVTEDKAPAYLAIGAVLVGGIALAYLIKKG